MKKINFIVIPLMALPFCASCGGRQSLEECSWEKISEVSKAGKAQEWFKIGDTKKVQLKHQTGDIFQTVRIIDFNHDDLANGTGKAGITFEFVDLISDGDGYSLATPWNWEQGGESTNTNYLDSSLRKAIDGNGSTSTRLRWYQKGQEGEVETPEIFRNKTVFDMLPNDLAASGIIKEVKKPIAISDNSEYTIDTENYKTKLFPLSYCEMTSKNVEDAMDEGTTYEFYKNNGDVDANRIKHQIKWHDGALVDDDNPPAVIDDGSTASNYAGFNETTSEYGGYSWLRSPNIVNNKTAWFTYFDGELTNSFVYDDLLGVAPAFCI